MQTIRIKDFLNRVRSNLKEACETTGIDQKVVSTGSVPNKRRHIQVRITKKCDTPVPTTKKVKEN